MTRGNQMERLDTAKERIRELKMARVEYSEKKGWKTAKAVGNL